MLSSNIINNNYISFLISKDFISSLFFYQKQKYVIQIQFLSLIRKEYIALIKYILLVVSFCVFPSTLYTKLYSNQKQINYRMLFFFYSKITRNNCFILQKLFLEEKKKKSIFFVHNFLEICIFYNDVLHDKLLNKIWLSSFAQQKIFLFKKVNKRIYAKKQKNSNLSTILLQYDFLSFWGYSFFKK